MQDVRSKDSQNTYDLGGKSSAIIKGIHRYNTYDNNEALIAVNVSQIYATPYSNMHNDSLKTSSLLILEFLCALIICESQLCHYVMNAAAGEQVLHIRDSQHCRQL